jgi:hypothetical protein
MVGDNSYIKSRSKSETTAIPTLEGKLKKKDELADMNVKRTKQNEMDLKVKNFGQPMICKGLYEELDGRKIFELIMDRCDNSYKIIGAIRTTETHLMENNLNREK